MPPARHIGISYTRFSGITQRKGDSQDRQDLDYRNFCQRHNLTPLTQVFADKGRSGYTDEHRKKGKLGVLVAMAKDKHFDPGTVIVVEAWDRLGRLRPDRQTDLIAELLRMGLRIGVCRLDDIFSEDDFGTHKWTTLAVFIQLAYQESKQKAERLAGAWQRRREKARRGDRGGAKMLAGELPGWLEKTEGGEGRLIPERAAVVKRIFRMAADGLGDVGIVGALDREGVEPFGKPGPDDEGRRPRFCGWWTRSYIRRLLTDRRAVGEVQPRTADGKPDGAPIPGFFPAAVSEEEYRLARAARATRDNRKDKSGRALVPRQSKHVNVFRGLLTHARDGEGLILENQGVARPAALASARGTEGRGRSWTFPYLVFEEAVLSLLREVSAADVLPKAAEGPSRAEVLRARLADVRADILQIKEDLRRKYRKHLSEVLSEKEDEEEALAQGLQEELARTARPAERAWKDLPRLIDLLYPDRDDVRLTHRLKKLQAPRPDDVRLKLRVVLRGVVDDIHVLIVPRGSYRLAVVQVHFAGGRRRDYLILHRTAGFCRAGGAWAGSAADVAELGPADLRERARVADAERFFEAVDVEGLKARLAPLGRMSMSGRRG
jgi:DNA invertase Pin-like site-specific DNA recombinase